MGIEQFEVGMRIEATSDFEVEEMLAAPTGGGAYEVKTGDTGEVINKQVVGRSAWLRVRWDRLKRDLNVDRHALPHVRPLSEE